MNKYTFYLILAMLPSILHAEGKNMKVLDKAYMNALDKQYKQAIEKTLPLLDSLQLNKVEEIVLAHQILSLSYCETGNEKKALEHLKALRAFSPKEDFRVFNPSPACSKLLNTPTTSKKPTINKKKN